MFPDLSKFSEPEKLRKLMVNARRLGHDDYAFQIRMRIAELAGLPFRDPLEGDWAMDPNPTEGLDSLVEHQRAELSGEAIVVRHADKFSVEAVAAAAAKLAAKGITREQVA